MFSLKTINNTNNNLGFQGIYKPTISVISVSSEETVREYENQNKDVLEQPDYALGEESLASLIGQRFKELASLFFNKKNNPAEIKKNLDLIA